MKRNNEEHQINKPKNWSLYEYREYCKSGKIPAKNNPPVSSANLESTANSKQVEKKRNTRFTSRVDILVHSYRYRLADSDGISAKAVIDEIVNSGILVDDSPRFIREVRFRQTKIKKPQDEKTEIIIEEVK